MSRTGSGPKVATASGCLGGSVLALGVLVLLGVVALGSVARPFPSPTPLPRANGQATDAFTLSPGIRSDVRRLSLDVPQDGLPGELRDPAPVYLQADVDAGADGALQLAVVDGSGTQMVRQQRVDTDVDLRWQIACPLEQACHEDFDVIFSRSDTGAALDVRWSVKAQIRYPQGGLAPFGLALTLAVAPASAPAVAILSVAGEPETIELSGDAPYAIRHVHIALTGTAGIADVTRPGLRGFLRTKLTEVPAATLAPTLPQWAQRLRDAPPVDVLAWIEGAPEPLVTRSLTAPGGEGVDQLELQSACPTDGGSCSADLVVLFRLASDRADVAYRLSWRIEASLLGAAGSGSPAAASGSRLNVTPVTVPGLVTVHEVEASTTFRLTHASGFSAEPAVFSAVLTPGSSPASLTPGLPELPILATSEVTATATLAGSSRRPPVQLRLSRHYGEAQSVRQFRPGEEPLVRLVAFDGCAGDRACGTNLSIDAAVVEVASVMTPDETVSVHVTVRVTVLGFASARTDGAWLTGEFR